MRRCSGSSNTVGKSPLFNARAACSTASMAPSFAAPKAAPVAALLARPAPKVASAARAVGTCTASSTVCRTSACAPSETGRLAPRTPTRFKAPCKKPAATDAPSATLVSIPLPSTSRIALSDNQTVAGTDAEAVGKETAHEARGGTHRHGDGIANAETTDGASRRAGGRTGDYRRRGQLIRKATDQARRRPHHPLEEVIIAADRFPQLLVDIADALIAGSAARHAGVTRSRPLVGQGRVPPAAGPGLPRLLEEAELVEVVVRHAGVAGVLQPLHQAGAVLQDPVLSGGAHLLLDVAQIALDGLRQEPGLLARSWALAAVSGLALRAPTG